MTKATVTVTRKGQVTIPKAIREELGLKPHDQVRITLDGQGGAILTREPSLRELMGSLPANGLSLEEAMERIDEARAEHYLQKYRRIFGEDFLSSQE